MGGLDVVAIGAYAAVVLAIGLRAGPRAAGEPGSGGSAGPAANSQDWLVARRDLPTWAVLGSMVATELSAATFVGVPHAAFTGDWSYLQLAFGALAGKWVLARYVIPLYHALGVTTVYGFLSERFGLHTRRAAAVCFVAGRTLASGARLFIAALAFSLATGLRIEWAILGSALVAGLYTGRGGLRAVVWTDVLQAGVFVTAALTTLALLVGETPGGLAAILDWARTDARTQVFHTDPFVALFDGRPLGSAFVAGFFLTLATHATDHDMVQRLLAARDGRRGGRALRVSAYINFPMTLLFLAIGTALAHHHAVAPPGYTVDDARQVLPLFALHELPDGLRGLVFAGLFAAAMSSLDSAICAIGATWLSDVAPHGSDREIPTARLRRVSATTCIALAAAALAMAGYQQAVEERGGELPSLVEFALSSMSVLYGGLLGVFAAAFARAPRPSAGAVGAIATAADVARDRRAVAALIVGGAIGLALFLQPLWSPAGGVLAWGYRIPVAAFVSFAVALAPLGRARDAH